MRSSGLEPVGRASSIRRAVLEWGVRGVVVRQGNWVDAIEIKGAGSERVDKKKYPNRRFAWCTQAEFWEKYCELDGGAAATLKMPSPKPY